MQYIFQTTTHFFKKLSLPSKKSIIFCCALKALFGVAVFPAGFLNLNKRSSGCSLFKYSSLIDTSRTITVFCKRH